MPTDPNARRDQALKDIVGALTKTNKLLETQGKLLERIERNTRPTKILVGQSPYLEVNKPNDGDAGRDDSTSEGTSVG